MNLDKQQRTRLAIALGAVVALVLGFAVLNKSDSSTNSTASAKTQFTPGGQNGQAPPGATGGGMAPGGQGGPPGQGGPQMSEVTGSAATKAKAAAEDAVDGTADRVFKNPQGSGYIVMVRGDSAMTIVEVSSSYKVTGKREMQGPPNGGQGGPPSQSATQ